MYDKVTMFGKQEVDFLWVKKEKLTPSFLYGLDPFPYEPVWDNKTYFLCTYGFDIHGSNVSGLKGPITGWVLYRQKKGQSNLELVAKLDADELFVYDYAVANFTEYKYVLFIQDSVSISNRLESNYILNDNFTWSLTSIDESDTKNLYYAKDVWLLDLNLKSADLRQNLNKNVLATFNRFPKVAQSQRNYISGSITCMLGKINNATHEYEDSVDLQEAWFEFVNDGRVKVLKDRRGLMFLCDINESSQKILDETRTQAVEVNLSYVQIGDVKNMSIIGVV